ncbi:MAG TPA: hypothetical protein VHY91_20710 [Pirellulales bacterium]|nr:hypothetical protein [Pirellulales bacterium]
MMQRYLRTIALALCSSFIIGEKIVHSADVDDGWRQTLLEGIEGRESAIHSLRVKYTIVHESTDLARAQSMKVLRERVEEGRLSQKEADKEASEPWRRKIVTNVALLMSGGKIAAATADADPNSGWEPKRVVFDGEVLTRLEGDLGDRKLATPDEALPSTTIDSFSLVGTMPLQDFIKLSGAKCTLLPRTAASGDVVFQVTFTDQPQKHEGVEVQQSETTVEINAAKSFWPQYLPYGFFFNVDTPKTLFNWREVQFSDFQKAGNIDIPHKIEETCSDIVNTTTGDFDLGRDWGVTARTTLIVNEIAINEPVAASEFVLTFPPGTRYIDLDGVPKIVDPDGTIRNLSATLGERSRR